MQLFRRQIIYIQVYPDHFVARSVGDGRVVRRYCRALDNRREELKDFSRIRPVLRSLIRDLATGFSLRRPVGLLHFIPQYYVPTQHELGAFKKVAERAGISFCLLSTWENQHADRDISAIVDML